MATAVADKMTVEEFLALPEDDVERWLINGELREKPMSVRNRFHSSVTVRVCRFLDEWRDRQPQPRGRVYAGDAGVRLGDDSDTLVGVDAAFVSAEVESRQTDRSTIIRGIPILMVEILSPSNSHEEIIEKRTTYLAAGVPLVWIIDPDSPTVIAFRSDAKPQLFNDEQDLTAEPHLPGFRVPVAQLFE